MMGRRLGLAAALLLLAALFLLAPAQTARGKLATRALTGEQPPDEAEAQALALADSRVQAMTSGRRTEVFGVRALGAEHTALSAACAESDCRQVEIYDFDADATVLAIVDLPAGLVRDVVYQPGVHPGANQRVSDLAIAIARAAPELRRELGFVPAAGSLTPMDSGLAGSNCDSGHLCLAVTVPDGQSLVWAVVDMTTSKLAGVVRTPVQPDEAGPSVPAAGAECPAAGSVVRGGWTLKYETTSTDGFRIYDAAYAGIEAVESAKIVEWHVDYGSTGFSDATGCGGGGGYTILPSGETQIVDLLDGASIVGFEVDQDFRMPYWGNNCNYRYGQHYQFYKDGRFRIVGAAYGRGCSMTGIYRPVMRLDLAVAGQAGDTYAIWDGLHWRKRTVEGWWPQTALVTPEGYAWRVTDASGLGYFIEPGTGQFGDTGRGDFAYIYATHHQPAEGDTDLGAIGGCCNDDEHQGPEAYLNGEPIVAGDLVLWYVAQMQTEVNPGSYYCWTVSNLETYPCPAGPMFVPVQHRNYMPIFGK
jgi:hypothetical protein